MITSSDQRHTYFLLSRQTVSVYPSAQFITAIHHSSGRNATMQKHIFQPISDLNKPQRPMNREDRLKTIIANLEKHEQDVKYGATLPQLY